MKTFDAIMNRWFIPVAMRIANMKGICAIRDAFLQIFPFTLAGSLVVVINNVIFASNGFIGQFLVGMFPNIDQAQAVLSSVLTGTNTVMSLFIVFLVARNMAREYKGEGNKAGITALTAFFIFYPIENLESGSYFSTNYFGANGLFIAIIIGLIVGWGFTKLARIEKIRITMPDTVPPEVAKSFNVTIPIIIVLVVCAILNFIVLQIDPNGLNALIYTMLQTPLTALGGNVATIFILEFLAMLLWCFGIHGTATVSPIYKVLFAEANIVNLDFAAAHATTVGAPYPYTWQSLFENFGGIGGTGNTLGLIIAILICTKFMKDKWNRDDYSKVARMSIIPGLFSINEPMIFGLPIVLNPILMIPFVLAPLVNTAIGALEIFLGLVPPGVLDAGWATPQPIKAFLSTSGAWQSIVSQILAITVATLIYLPFVIAANKAAKQEKQEEETQA